MSSIKRIGENLDILMVENGLSANKLASATGIPASTIKKIRSMQDANPTVGTLLPLADFFNLSLEQFIAGDVLACTRQAPPSHPIPLKSWDTVLATANKPNTYIYSEKSYSTDAFALHIIHDDIPLFSQGCLLVIEPNIEATHGDILLLARQDEVQLRRLIKEDNQHYLQSLRLETHTTLLDETHTIVGVAMESRTQLKPSPTQSPSTQLNELYTEKLL